MNRQALSLPIIFESSPRDDGKFVRFGFCHLKMREPSILHYHNELEIGKCIDGGGFCLINGKKTHYGKDYIQIVLPFQPHYNIADKGSAYWNFATVKHKRISSENLSLSPGFVMELMKNTSASGVFPPDRYPRLTALVTEIILLSREVSAPRTDDLLAAYIAALLTELSRVRENTAPLIAKIKPDIILPALRAVAKSLEKSLPVTTKTLADACFLSESHFRRIFKEVVGESPHDYIIRSQVIMASRLLLSTDKSVREIIDLCGACDASTFFRRFKKNFGCTPDEYRKTRKNAVFIPEEI